MNPTKKFLIDVNLIYSAYVLPRCSTVLIGKLMCQVTKDSGV